MVTSNDKSLTDADLAMLSGQPLPKRRGRPTNAERAARLVGSESPDLDPDLEAELDAEEVNEAVPGKRAGNGANPGVTGLGAVSNDGDAAIGKPFTIHLSIQGTADLLFHRYSADEVEEKANAAKGSRAKKTDNIES